GFHSGHAPRRSRQSRSGHQRGGEEVGLGTEDVMMLHIVGLALLAVSVAACANSNSGTAPTQSGPPMSFFVTSSRSSTGNLGGLSGADSLCQNLPNASGLRNTTVRPYLSVRPDAHHGNR